MINVWIHFTNNNFSTPTSIKEIFDQTLFLNPHTKLDFNFFFLLHPPMNISDTFTTIRDIRRFLQPGYILQFHLKRSQIPLLSTIKEYINLL